MIFTTHVERLVTLWPVKVAGVSIVVGWAINLFGVDCNTKRIGFEYDKMPHMQPIIIPTQGKGFWGAIWIWLAEPRHWTIVEDWHYKLDGVEYVVPKGFDFDGASSPRILWWFLPPTGILLLGGLVHDYAYRYGTLEKKGGGTRGPMTQKEADVEFRDICIEQNGFHFLNYLAYWALRVGGFIVWNRYRANDKKAE